MTGQRIRVKLRAFDHKLIDQSTYEIVATAKEKLAALEAHNKPLAPVEGE